ncbi:MAG TPA: phenylacetate-CoA oxygenase/reductase subunit PaaK [Ferruginibacter sp.]|nr:phenylacetate-CoA oxygenase/reductase subunit PaaK [Ferruginibacter sp.]
MAVHFHSLKIKNIKKETLDCVSIHFEIPEHLANEFLYKEGQNITIKALIDGSEIRRSYSVCTAPYQNEIKVVVKEVPGGLFSAFAQHLKIGDELSVLPPVGKFNAKLKEGKGNYLAIAAGSGITPIISIIKHTLHCQPKSNFTLIYGNKSRNSIIFFEELEAVKNKNIEHFNFINILSREKTDAPINYGRINKDKLQHLQQLIDFKNFDSAYLCGPEEMIFSASSFLEEAGLEKNKIHFELFTTPGLTAQKKQEVSTKENFNIGPVSNVTVKLDGRSFDFNLSQNGNSILDAALQQGADLPYACKGGVCCTCRAKLINGQVSMDVNYALEQEEIEQGFILTCQSHPLSEKVVIDFDVK